ncbi:DUF927 domain-containing protein [Methylobacterium nodulans]|nr:DUF927 domain-containing protein [Methylobacterium nodulans]
MPVPDNAPPAFPRRHRDHGEPAAVWAYPDAEGRVLFYACRFALADGGKTYCPLTLFEFPNGALRWIWKGPPVPRPLYGLDQLAARPEAYVLLCEGEKSADAARTLVPDYVAITSPNGSKNARYADWSPLRGRHVVIWPDADKPGLDYAHEAATLALRAGAFSVALVEPPADVSAVGWDAADALDEGWTAERAGQLVAAAKSFSAAGAGDPEGLLAATEGDTSAGTAPIDENLPPVARLRPEIKWPYGYRMTAKGLVFKPKQDEPGEWLSGPFDVHALVRTEEGTGWSLAISFRDPDGRLQTVVVALADIAAGDASDVRREMASKGLRLASGRGAKDRFVSALASLTVDLRAMLVSRSGWHANGEVYAAPNFTATTPEREAEPIVFRAEQQATGFRTSGTLGAWIEEVGALAAGQGRLLFSLGVAFAGPLLEPLGQEPGAFNLVGPSSCGKTTALRMAGSVWGGGGPLGFAATWRTTSNALEGTAAAHNDSLLALDELGMCEPRDLDAAAYALTGGSGKGRLKADGDLRTRQRWRIMVLSTGEITLAQRIAEGAVTRNVRAGQMVRFVDVPADAGQGLGLFDHLAGYGHGSELSNAIRDRTGRLYGTAGPAFVNALLAKREGALGTARALIAAFLAERMPAGAGGQVQRVGARFALVAAAGELATAFGLLPVERGAVTAAAESIFRQWLAQRGGTGASEDRDALKAVRDFLQRHAAARFIKAAHGLDEGSWRAQNVAGFRLGRDEENGDFVFHDAGWAEATQGLDPRAAADALASAGFLVLDARGKRKRAERIGQRTMRVYRVAASILDGEDV